MQIARLGSGDEHTVLAAEQLFDARPTEEGTARFLASDGHHLLVALGDADEALGFVSGVETTHPDKGTEMFLYELAVHPEHRIRGGGARHRPPRRARPPRPRRVPRYGRGGGAARGCGWCTLGSAPPRRTAPRPRPAANHEPPRMRTR